MAVFVLRVLLAPWAAAVEAAESQAQRRAYVDDLTMWRRGRHDEVGVEIARALEATRRFEEAADWHLNAAKLVHFANTAAFRRWPRASGGGIPAATTFKDLGVMSSAGPGRRAA
eukprot:3697752-Lingulodinium_polyedra.AAC.1